MKRPGDPPCHGLGPTERPTRSHTREGNRRRGERVLGCEQAKGAGALDRLAAGGGTELAVDRQGLGFHGVLGEVQVLADLPK